MTIFDKYFTKILFFSKFLLYEQKYYGRIVQNNKNNNNLIKLSIYVKTVLIFIDINNIRFIVVFIIRKCNKINAYILSDNHLKHIFIKSIPSSKNLPTIAPKSMLTIGFFKRSFAFCFVFLDSFFIFFS